jgi:hypothetical protein
MRKQKTDITQGEDTSLGMKMKASEKENKMHPCIYCRFSEKKFKPQEVGKAIEEKH